MSGLPVMPHKDVLLETLELEDRRILDIGCGDGKLVRMMAHRGAEAVGLEPSQERLKACRAAESLPGASYVEGGGESLPFDSSEFDAVVIFNSLHHIPGEAMAACLAESARVLRPGGELWVLEPIAEGPYFEVMRPVEDETEVRALAYAALQNIGPAFSPIEERVYAAPSRYDDFENWVREILAVDPARAEMLAEVRSLVAGLFEQNAEKRADGYHFAQPSRLMRFRRV
ncbi:MAG: class I SAM-dependent methyltransferase [Rhodovibrionaceae bacterium]